MTAKERFVRALQSSAGTALVLGPSARLGYSWYGRTGRTPVAAYSAMRKLFGAPSTTTFDALVARASREAPQLDVADAPGLIEDDRARVVAELCRDGIAVLRSRLPEAARLRLLDLASRTPATVIEPFGRDRGPAPFDPDRPVGVRYDLPEQALVEDATVQQLLADPSLLDVAQRYLGAAPIQDLVALWWTAAAPSGADASSAAAQLFHFDLDRLRFLKLFVYLTDVDADRGPHEYVRGSHTAADRRFRADRRFADDEVVDHFGVDAVATVTGPAGTMFLADTKGLHRGTPVRAGHRAVFQLEWASSLFGHAVTRHRLRRAVPELRSAVDRFAAAYDRFAIDR